MHYDTPPSGKLTILFIVTGIRILHRQSRIYNAKNMKYIIAKLKPEWASTAPHIEQEYHLQQENTMQEQNMDVVQTNAGSGRNIRIPPIYTIPKWAMWVIAKARESNTAAFFSPNRFTKLP